MINILMYTEIHIIDCVTNKNLEIILFKKKIVKNKKRKNVKLFITEEYAVKKIHILNRLKKQYQNIHTQGYTSNKKQAKEKRRKRQILYYTF